MSRGRLRAVRRSRRRVWSDPLGGRFRRATWSLSLALIACGGPEQDFGPAVAAHVRSRGSGIVDYDVLPGAPALVGIRCDASLITDRLMGTGAMLPAEARFRLVDNPWERHGLEVVLREATVVERPSNSSRRAYRIEAEVELRLPHRFRPRDRIQNVRFAASEPLVEGFGLRLVYSPERILSVRAPDGIDCDDWNDFR